MFHTVADGDRRAMNSEQRELVWRWRDACAAVGAAQTDGPDIFGISIDTRSLQPGDLFVALLGDPGPRFNTDSRTDRDGHAFIDDAQRRGAIGAMTHRASETSLPELRVADTLDGLWALGSSARATIFRPGIRDHRQQRQNDGTFVLGGRTRLFPQQPVV